MIYDPTLTESSVILETSHRKTLLETRTGIIPDHLIDALIRAKALSLRLNLEQDLIPASADVIRDITRINHG